MSLTSRLAALERAIMPQGCDPADRYTDEELVENLASFTGLALPDLPLPVALSRRLRQLWDSTLGLGDQFRIVGYSPRMLQISFRRSAEQCGLPLRELRPEDIRPGEDIDAGPYTPFAAAEYRLRDSGTHTDGDRKQ